MKKTLLIILLFVALLSFVAIAYLGVTYRSVSSLMEEAKVALKSNEIPKAERLLFAVVKKDPANEEAYRTLAQIAEGKQNYASAAYFWDRTAALNPLNPDYLEAMFSAVCAAGADEYFIFKYTTSAPSKKLSEIVRFRAAGLFLRVGNPQIYDEIVKSLEADKSQYLDLLSAQTLIRTGKIADGKAIFNKIIEGNYPDVIKNEARIGNAICAFLEDDVATANAFIEKTKATDPAQKADVLLLKANILLRENKTKEALVTLCEAQKIRRERVGIALDCAEMALSVNDSATIANIRKEINVKTQQGLMLDNYFAALECAAKEDNAGARDNMLLAGNYKNRTAARILMLHAACKLKLGAEAAEQANLLFDSNQLRGVKLRETIVNELMLLLSECERTKDYASIEKISLAIVRLAPNNVHALRYALNSLLVKKDLVSALTTARHLEKLLPGDRQAYEATLLTLGELKRHAESLRIAEEYIAKNGMDPVSATFAARGAARTGNIEKAFTYYKEAFKTKELPIPVILEIGNFFLSYKIDEVPNFCDTLDGPDRPEYHDTISSTFRARYLFLEGKRNDAVAVLKKAVEKSPKIDALYAEMALLEYIQGNIDVATKVLQDGLQAIPDSQPLKLRLGLILSENLNPSSAPAARKILEALEKTGPDAPYIYAALSNLCDYLKDPDAAMNYARLAERSDSTNDEALLALGRRLAERGQYSEAIPTLLRIKTMSNNTRAQTSLLEAFEKAIINTSAAYRKSLSASILKALPDNPRAKEVYNQAEAELVAKKDELKKDSSKTGETKTDTVKKDDTK